MKNELTEQEIIDLCASMGVHFVNRSYGKVTTATVTLEAIKQIVNKAHKMLTPVQYSHFGPDESI